MPKLHELLAIDSNLKSQADKCRTDLTATFKTKPHHFTEKTVSYRPFNESEQPVVESQLDLQTSVHGELKWIAPFIQKSLDVAYQVAEANTMARADVTLDNGTVMITQVPVTSLLELEKRMKELHDFIAAIPTLDPAKGFKADPARGDGIYQAREDVKKRTKKVQSFSVIVPATKEHPAQVAPLTEDVPVGEIKTLEWSGLISVAEKGDMLNRVEELTRAIKRARSRANEANIDTGKYKIGHTLVSYVFGL